MKDIRECSSLELNELFRQATTEAALANAIYLAWMRDERWKNELFKNPERPDIPICFFWAELAARAILAMQNKT